jgi:hypothetical protein
MGAILFAATYLSQVFFLEADSRRWGNVFRVAAIACFVFGMGLFVFGGVLVAKGFASITTVCVGG